MPKTDSNNTSDPGVWEDEGKNHRVKAMRRAARADKAKRHSARIRREAEATRPSDDQSVDQRARGRVNHNLRRNEIRHIPKRCLSVEGSLRREPDVRRFARTVIALAVAEAERAAAEAESSKERT